MAVEDGHESPEFAEISANAFSPDSAHLAYAVWKSRGGGAKLLLDGKEIADASGMANPVFTPDGKHVGYVTFRSEAVRSYRANESGNADLKRAVALDGHSGAEYFQTGHLQFSPDSMHLAYSAETEAAFLNHDPERTVPGGKWTVVLDGNVGTQYSYVAEDSLRFGADGALEFLAARKNPNTKESLYRVRYLPNK